MSIQISEFVPLVLMAFVAVSCLDLKHKWIKTTVGVAAALFAILLAIKAVQVAVS